MPAGKQPGVKPVPPQLQNVARFVKLMDSQFQIPGTKISFGLDPLIGLIPGLGDLIDYAISALLLIAMVRNGADGKVVARMILNISIDGIVGLIPVLGRFFDFFYKANRKNLVLATEHFGEGRHRGSATSVVVLVLSILTGIFILLAVLSYFAIKWVWMFLHSL
ncbi:MAG: hypothetical protein JWN78_1688 [Bacteroidota bacterium]|nr:hypothetical protein [Bacteroidota bacterium]